MVQVFEEVDIGEGLVAQVASVSKQHRHTLVHTGLMCWESCLPLARFLLAAPCFTHGAHSRDSWHDDVRISACTHYTECTGKLRDSHMASPAGYETQEAVAVALHQCNSGVSRPGTP